MVGESGQMSIGHLEKLNMQQENQQAGVVSVCLNCCLAQVGIKNIAPENGVDEATPALFAGTRDCGQKTTKIFAVEQNAVWFRCCRPAMQNLYIKSISEVFMIKYRRHWTSPFRVVKSGGAWRYVVFRCIIRCELVVLQCRRKLSRFIVRLLQQQSPYPG